MFEVLFSCFSDLKVEASSWVSIIGDAYDTDGVVVESVNIISWNGKEVWTVDVGFESDFKRSGMEDSIITDVDFISGGGGVWERLMTGSFKIFSNTSNSGVVDNGVAAFGISIEVMHSEVLERIKRCLPYHLHEQKNPFP